LITKVGYFPEAQVTAAFYLADKAAFKALKIPEN
jgi:hypothetical protein